MYYEMELSFVKYNILRQAGHARLTSGGFCGAYILSYNGLGALNGNNLVSVLCLYWRKLG